jgi:hypothetical protein
MQFAEMDSAKGPRCGRTNCITYFRVLPKLVGGLTGQMGCAVAKPRSAVVARKVRPIQVGGMGGLVGFPRQLSLVLVTIAGMVFSGAAPCQHGRGGCPAHGQCRRTPDAEQSAEAAISRAGGAGRPAWRKTEPGDLSRQRSIRRWSIGHGSCYPFLRGPRLAAVNGSVGANRTGGLPSQRISRP